MKKSILILLAVFLICGLVFAQTQPIPAPFDKAKALALQVEPNSMGRYILPFVDSVSGIEYVIGYIPEDHFIGIGMRIPVYQVIEYNEETGKCSVYRYPQNERIEISNDKAIEEAFKIFRALVLVGFI
jgi:hypothetical protein